MIKFGYFPTVFSRLTGQSIWSQTSRTIIRKESALAALRKKTGFAFILCKKALELNEQDINKAESWLKKEAAKQGWEKSKQLQHRATREGLIGVYVDQQGKRGVLLEVNCETDFVARNETFKQLVTSLTTTMATAQIVNKNAQTDKLDKQTIKKYNIKADDLMAFKDDISTAVTRLGENIKLNKATLLHNLNDEVKLIGYAHASGTNSTMNDVMLGKYGTILAIKDVSNETDGVNSTIVDPKKETKSESKTLELDHNQENTDENKADQTQDQDDENTVDPETHFVSKFSEATEVTSMDEVAKLICQHIVGVKPQSLGSATVEIKNGEEAVNKSNEDKSGDEEESTVLLNQKFLLDEDITVRDFLISKKLAVVDFERYECGD